MRTSRRHFLGGVAASAGLSLAGHGCGTGTDRPNILWVIAEDFSPDLGCYGNSDLETPNIDRLATQGMRFTSAFMTAPVCSAARSALVVGMYQTSVGGHNHRSHRSDNFSLPTGVRPFTHYLREADYHTSNLQQVEGVGGTGKTDFNFNAENVYDGSDWRQRPDAQSFYAQVNFPETHRAFKRFRDRPVDPAAVHLPPYYPDHPAVRLDWATYLDDAQHLDVNVGNVLQRLEEDGLVDDTIVFFFGDHGRAMPRGKQFLYDSGIRIPLIVRIPEKFRVEGYQAGTVNDDLVSSIDITATTLRLAGVEPPAHMQGRPFFGPGVVERNHIFAARDRCDETVDRIRCVRDHRFKYLKNFYPDRPYTQQNVYKDTQYATLRVMRDLKQQGKLTGPPALFMADQRPPEEFYDVEADPHEINNLINAPEHQDQIQGMRNLLTQWISETGDKGEIPEQGVEEQDRYRAEVDGWCSRTNCTASKAGGRLRVDCEGANAHILRSYVTEGGDLSLEFRARSRDVSVRNVTWGTVEELRNPGFTRKVGFQADGNWHEYSTSFQAEGYTALLTIEFGEANGQIEFDWIRVVRTSGSRTVRLQQWDFA